MSEFGEEHESTARAAEVFGSLNDETLPPEVNEFAHFISDRLNPNLEPGGFVLASVLAIHVLKAGVDGYSKESVKSSLVGRSDAEYDVLLANLPELATRGFSEEFAYGVMKEMVTIDLLPAPEAADKNTLGAGEIIAQPIDTIDDAYEQIIEDAKTRIMALDWAHFDIKPDDAGDIYEALYAALLRNAPFETALTVLRAFDEHEAGQLEGLSSNEAIDIGGGLWLTMLAPKLPAELAMATRDQLYLKGSEAIAFALGKDPLRAAAYFATDINGPYGRAYIRLANFQTAQ